MRKLILVGLFSLLADVARGSETASIDVARQLVVTIANDPQPRLGGAGSTWKGWSWSGGYQTTAQARQVARKLALDYQLTAVDDWPISLLDVFCVVYAVSEGVQRSVAVRRLGQDPRVASVQPLQQFQARSNPAPEPLSDMQHNLRVLGVTPGARWPTGTGVRVAVVDTGMQRNHPDIVGQVVDHQDFAKRNGDTFDDDLHGTAVAGIIAAVADNKIGIAGIAPAAKVLALKACWPSPDNSNLAYCNSFTLAQALAAAAEHRADVINLSLTGPPDPLLEALVLRLLARGIVVVGAAGEELADFPVGIAGIIAVANTENVTGGEPGSWPKNFVSAPGSKILTTVPGSTYAFQSGSSMSAAQVSGLVALMLQRAPQLGPERIVDILLSTRPMQGNENRSIHACRALAALDEELVCDDK